MDPSDFLRRLDDLLRRCERANVVTATVFLTPAEQAQAASWLRTQAGCRTAFYGGGEDCERRVLFFLPDWLDAPEPDAVCAVRLTAHFGTPGHRDYLGALLARGIRREWLGDLRVIGEQAYVFCLPSVRCEVLSLDRAGSVHLTAEAVQVQDVPAPEKRVKPVSFTVQSQRFDAVLGALFSISRTQAARRIAEGAASLNYLPCLKPDAQVQDGDVISLRGAGKGVILSLGGHSRKGRLYVHAERYL